MIAFSRSFRASLDQKVPEPLFGHWLPGSGRDAEALRLSPSLQSWECAYRLHGHLSQRRLERQDTVLRLQYVLSL
jgi:hypothetical protein